MKYLQSKALMMVQTQEISFEISGSDMLVEFYGFCKRKFGKDDNYWKRTWSDQRVGKQMSKMHTNDDAKRRVTGIDKRSISRKVLYTFSLEPLRIYLESNGLLDVNYS